MVHDFVQRVDELAADRRRFYVSPSRWQGSRVTTPLAWTRVKFGAGYNAHVPAMRGVYAFVVQHDNDHFPPHGFIMYIGITGARRTERTLRLRFADYLREKVRNKRPRVFYMLNKYENDLFFYFVPIADNTFDLVQLELDLNDSILPPVVVKDFSVEIRALVRALRNDEAAISSALRGRFGNWAFYSVLMTLNQVAQYVKFAQEVHATPRANLSRLIQRELSTGRSLEIAEYLRRNEDRFFNSLVVAVYGGDPAWHEFDVKPTSADVSREDLSDTALYSIGYLSLTGDEELFALDGQHRVAGIRTAFGASTSLGDDEVSVLVVAHHNDEAGLRRTRKLFTTLNRTAKPVKKSEIIALDESDVMAISTRFLVEEHPFFNNGQVDIFKKQANLHPNNFDVFTTIINIYDTLGIIFAYVKEKVGDDERAQLRYFRPSDEKVEEYNSFASEYYERLAATFPDLGGYFESKTPTEVLKRNRSLQNSHILFRPIGQIMFANILRRLRASLSLDESMGLIGRLPARMQEPPYAGVIWNPQRGLVDNRREPLCRDLLLYMLRRYTRDREILRQRYAEALEREIESTRLPRPVV